MVGFALKNYKDVTVPHPSTAWIAHCANVLATERVIWLLLNANVILVSFYVFTINIFISNLGMPGILHFSKNCKKGKMFLFEVSPLDFFIRMGWRQVQCRDLSI